MQIAQFCDMRLLPMGQQLFAIRLPNNVTQLRSRFLLRAFEQVLHEFRKAVGNHLRVSSILI